jgi:hypothetical protein
LVGGQVLSRGGDEGQARVWAGGSGYKPPAGEEG